MDSFKKALYDRLQQFYEGIVQMKLDGLAVDAIAPAAGIYLSIRIDLPDAQAWLLKAGIAVLPFSVFGSHGTDNWFRISVGTCKVTEVQIILSEMRAAIERQQMAIVEPIAVFRRSCNQTAPVDCIF